MNTTPIKTHTFTYFIAATLTGLSIGWFVGLSGSPIVGTVLGAILALLPTALTVLAVTSSKDRQASEPLSIATLLLLAPLCLGIAIGATLGLYTRTHSLLSPTPAQLLKRWTDAEYSLEELKEPFLKAHFGTDNPVSDARNVSSAFWNDLSENQSAIQSLLRVTDDAALMSQLSQLAATSKSLAAVYDRFENDAQGARKALTLLSGPDK